MKQFITIIAVLFCTATFSQVHKFDFTYNRNYESSVLDVIESDSSFQFFGFNGQQPNIEPLFFNLTFDGQFIIDSVPTNKTNWSNEIVLKNDSLKVLIEKSSNPSPIAFAISILSNKWDTLYKKIEISDSLIYVINNAKILNDSSLFVVGGKLGSIGYNAFLYHYNIRNGEDTLIDIINKNIQFEFISDVLAFDDKIYIIKSINRDTTNNCNAVNELIVFNEDFSTDTSVSICNSVAYHQGLDLYFVLSALKINSTTFMMSGRSQGNNVSNMNQKREDISIVKWDTNFTELNAAIFGKRDSFALEANHGMSRFENDSFVYVGGTENYTVNPSGYDTTTSYYLLSKVDLQGNVLWTRYYTNNTYLQLWKVLATSDGGALMVGTSYDHQNANGLEKDVWIVKVDSNGDYRTSTSVPEMSEIPSNDYVFYPNPVKEQLTFRQVNHLREIQIELYDLNGKKVLDHFSNQSEQNIDVSGLAKGTYVYRLVDSKGNYASGKISKQ